MISSAGLNERGSSPGGFGGAGWKGWFRACGAVRAANGAVGTHGVGWGGPLPDHCRPVREVVCQPGHTTGVVLVGSQGLRATGPVLRLTSPKRAATARPPHQQTGWLS